MSLAAAGFVCSTLGAGVIVAYTMVNYRLRRRGAGAVWLGGWLLGALGMTFTGLGWVLLAASGPHFDAPAARCAGALLAVAAAVLYLRSAVDVGRLRSRARYTLALHTEGIYRLVRHPQALALCLLAVGIGLASLSRPFLLLLPLWILYWVGYTYFEERFELLPAYGADYEHYRRTTGRLLPLPRSVAEAFAAARDALRRRRRELNLDPG
jgi:protein-S-isoprenylcysteine O-methyltransferase Ste14